MPNKFQRRYRIASTRLRDWDYSDNGAYFLTICTAHRQHFFGEIINSEMQLSNVGEYANKCWSAIPNHFPFFYLDKFVIMPNHLHGIIVIDKVTDGGFPSQTNADDQTTKTSHFRFRNQGRNTISAAVGSFKSAVTKYCNENRLQFGWQTRFHDHIVRNSEELYSIRNYIINNPHNWKDDRFY